MAFFVILKSYLVENEVLENFALRDHLPLKQGLRRSALLLGTSLFSLRDHLPLKQGLRHKLPCPFRIVVIPSETIFH